MSRLDKELIQNACDIHVHCGPSLFRRQDTVEIVTHSRDMGIRALILKHHHLPMVDRANYVKTLVPGIDVFGSLTLNHCVGGLNPFAVDVAIKFGAKSVWFPTIDAYHQGQYYGGLGGYGNYLKTPLPGFYQAAKGLVVTGDDGGVLPNVKDIIDLIAGANIILALGHIAPSEGEALVKAAAAGGVKKIVVDHPSTPPMSLSLEEQKRLVGMGAKMNYMFAEVSPKWWSISMPDFVKNIFELGPENVVLSSDCGQIHNPLPAEGLRILAELLLEEGVEPDVIKTMMVDIPTSLIYD